MPFDPDAYLAEQTGGDFNPDAYLSAKGVDTEPEQTFLKPGYKRHPFPNHQTNAEMRRSLDEVRPRIPTALDAAGASINNALDTYSLGAVNGLFGLGEAAGVPGAGRARENLESFRQEEPVAAAAGAAPAMMVEGPLRALGAGVERAVPVAKNALARVARAGVGSALFSAPVATSEALGGGATPREALGEGGKAALAGNIGGIGLGTMGLLGGAAASRVLSSKGAKARDFLTSRGVTDVGLTSSGTTGPAEGMPSRPTDADLGRQAEESASKGLAMLNEEKRGALGAVGRKISRISQTPEAATLHDVSDIVQNMQAASEELDASPQSRAALKDAIEAIKKKQGESFNPDTDPYMLSEADVNKLKRGLSRAGNVGTSTDEKYRPAATAAAQARDIVDQGPFAEANAEYAKESKHYQKSRKLLGITERPRTPEETTAAVNKVKNMITRRGQNTVTAGGQQAAAEEFAQRHPDIEREFEKQQIMRAKADLNFNLLPPGHGGLIERGAGAMLHNAKPLAGRVLYNPAKMLLGLEPMFLEGVPQLQNPLMEAARPRREAR